jgi:hypothetical protein
MKKKVDKTERMQELKRNNDKHMEEYEDIRSKLCFLEKEEQASFLLKTKN